MHAVVVNFRYKSECRALFVEAVLTNASDSLAVENGCKVFDVCEDAAASEIVLYELYTDATAFEAHLLTPHFAAFDTASAAWIVEKRVRQFERFEQFDPI